MERPSLPNLQELVPSLKTKTGYESVYAKQNPKLAILGCFEWNDQSIEDVVSKLREEGYAAVTEPVGGTGREQHNAKAFFILI